MDINCDLGEGEPLARTRALMRYATSVNIACGVHAGSAQSIATCVRLALQANVHVGAHPGLGTGRSKGRGRIKINPNDLELLLLHQVGAISAVAAHWGTSLHHIKLHGSLYHACDNDPALARTYVRTARLWWPEAVLFARAGGAVEALARRHGVEVWPEAFADRAYQDDGSLVARSRPDALLTRPADILSRIRTLIHEGRIQCRSGSWLKLQARTVCIHSDTPGALRIARLIRQLASGA